MDSIPHNATKQDLHHGNIVWEFIENVHTYISLNNLLPNLNTCTLHSKILYNYNKNKFDICKDISMHEILLHVSMVKFAST